jgi:DNA invertase Pin-like site-specific DNA recombinase
MPPANCDPRSRRLPEDPQAQRVVRVALYQRWPTLGENDFLQSYVDSQPGWRIALRSSDYGSGATLKRHGLQRVLTAARSDAIDVLVVNHMYNLSRTTRHLAFLLDELTSHGVRVVSAADPGLDTETPFGLFLVRVVSAVAEIEYPGALADRGARLRPEQESADESPFAG